MENLFVIFGGASVEHDVSIITGLQAIANLKTKFKIFPVYFSIDNKFYLTNFLKPKDYQNKDYVIKKSKQLTFFDGKAYFVKKKKNVLFMPVECVLNCCHGGAGENGDLSAYFMLNNIKLSSATSEGSCICMNKYLTKILARDLGINIVDGKLFTKQNQDDLTEFLKSKKGPLIIKPNGLGSSIGVIKSTKKDAKKNLDTVLHLDREAIVEDCIENMFELNCAVFDDGEELCLSLIEKVGDENDILSFDDKYCSRSTRREIPAKISEELKNKVFEYSKKIYKNFNLSGVIRIDYIYDFKNDILYLNEVNTIPGSLAFYLFEGLGIDYIMLIETILKNSKRPTKQTYFKSDILDKTGLKVK